MLTLVVSEKNIAARRIAEMLSKGKVRSKKAGSVYLYYFSNNGEDYVCLGLKGHILKVDFPESYSNWQKTNLSALVRAELIKIPTQKSLINLLKKQSKEADKVIIATDFDREGELIGVDAINQIKETNPNIIVSRARFSSLTPLEIKQAFSNLEKPYYNLAQAGEARQNIDLIWGASLTRFMSLSSKRLGNRFLSVGRVQSPTLALIVEREKQRQAFKPQTYWVLQAKFCSQDTEFIANHVKDKFWQKSEIEKVTNRLGNEGKVTSVASSKRKMSPPAPFNTTAFLSASASYLHISPASAMRIAENLYMQGFISYPRVDNTVYPKGLNIRNLLSALENLDQLGNLAKKLNSRKTLQPTKGKKKATDHPPIHPTAVAKPDSLDPKEWKVYELITRRFFATLAPASVSQSTKIEIEADGERFIWQGSCALEIGWQEYYPYGKKKDDLIPQVSEGDIVKLIKPIITEKETQPPPRYSQARLIQKMEELGLGTKATRHAIIKNLYDRSYIHSDPIVPTDIGFAMASTLKKYAKKIASPEMTAELEAEMDKIASGSLKQEEVVNRSRKILEKVIEELADKSSAIGEELQSGIQGGQRVGICPSCGGELRVIRSKKTRKRFVGCSNYPKCTTTYPLPQKGGIVPLGTNCNGCNTPLIQIINKGKRPWQLCINPNCNKKVNSVAKHNATKNKEE